MALEIERKFLVRGDAWRGQAEGPGLAMQQGYLFVGANGIARVRVAGDRAWLAVKSPTANLTRQEYEYPIPPADAREMLAGICEGRVLEKTRHRVPHGGFVWEIDEFGGANAGLVIAEIELRDAGDEPPRPEWLGPEVTGDVRYLNSSLTLRPYATW